MKQFSNQSNLYHAIKPKIDATSSEDNAPNNNQQSFKEQTKEFFTNLEKILIKQNQIFLGAIETTLKNVIHEEIQTLANNLRDVIHKENENSIMK